MSIESIYYRVKSEEFDRLPESEEEMLSLLEEITEDDSLLLDLGTYWHGVQFLITGNDSMPGDSVSTSLLEDIFNSGTKIPSQEYPIYVLSATKVNSIILALNHTSAEDFRDRLDPIVFYNANLYPTKGWSQEDLDDLIEIHNQLVDFFNCAAKENEAIVFRYL
jgi:Domain of unknown function (DUF1877)